MFFSVISGEIFETGVTISTLCELNFLTENRTNELCTAYNNNGTVGYWIIYKGYSF